MTEMNPAGQKHCKLIIIGSGPAGLSAAIYAARAELQPLVISGLVLYGQASYTNTIENYPGFPNGISGMEMGEQFERQAVKFGAKLLYEPVERLDLSKKPFIVNLNSGSYTSDALILAMGAQSKQLQIPGESEFLGRGVSTCANCDGRFFKNKKIHVVGGGDSALEESLFLTRFADSVTIIHRRNQLRAGAILINRAKENAKIHFLWETVVKEIRGEERVSSLLIENVKSGRQEVIPTEGLFTFIGHSPNTALVKDWVAIDPAGYVQIDGNFQTNIPGVFAAGEIADPLYRQVITSAGMGAAAAISASHYLDCL